MSFDFTDDDDNMDGLAPVIEPVDEGTTVQVPEAAKKAAKTTGKTPARKAKVTTVDGETTVTGTTTKRDVKLEKALADRDDSIGRLFSEIERLTRELDAVHDERLSTQSVLAGLTEQVAGIKGNAADYKQNISRNTGIALAAGTVTGLLREIVSTKPFDRGKQRDAALKAIKGLEDALYSLDDTSVGKISTDVEGS